MVVLAKVVVMELDEGLDGLIHQAHLDQSHLAVLPVREPSQSQIGKPENM